MRRREFITLLGGAAALPLAARAQQAAGRVYRIGSLTISSREQTLHLFRAFEEGLRILGYRVGENVAIEYRFADVVSFSGFGRVEMWRGGFRFEHICFPP